MDRKRILITGMSGLIGGIVRQRLEGKHDLSALNRRDVEGVECHRADIADLDAIRPAFEGVDTVVHLAAIARAEPAWKSVLQMNVIGTYNVFEAARIFDIQRVVWASSVAVFGLPEDYDHQQIGNDAPHFPKFIYGACKSLNERYAQHYFNEYDVDTIGLRFTAVYGVGRTRGMSSFTTQMIEAAALGKPYTVPFGDDEVDWQYVEDVSRSIVMSCSCPTTKTRVFTVKGGLWSVKEGFDYIKKLIPSADLTLEPGLFGISWDYDTTPVAEEIGFRPNYSMEQGIMTTINRFRQLNDLPLISES